MKRSLALLVAVAAVPLLFAGCGPSHGRDGVGDDGGATGDDGSSSSGDSNADHDGDGYTPAAGDCNDHDATIHPGATELCDGKDHDCDGVVDDTCDDDSDGWNVDPGGANGKPGGDCNDHDPTVNPGAIEIPGDGIDNDCDGMVDEAAAPCQTLPKSDPKSFAAAIDLCGPWLVAAAFNADANLRAHDVRVRYGAYVPKSGPTFGALSNGVVADEKDSSFVDVRPGTDFGITDPNPLPMNFNNGCSSGTDPTTIHDYVEYKVTLKVPTNANSFSFDFTFMSAEYPEFVGDIYNDKFLALLDSKSFKGNISFDKQMNPITVNAGFFDVCQTAQVCSGSKTNTCTQPVAQLDGTGYEKLIVDPNTGQMEPMGGGTGWLHTTSPVTPGETATLRFIVFDEGDGNLDSAVLIDNFKWGATPTPGPTTIQ